MFVDINFTNLLGHTNDVTNIRSRRISSEHPEQAQIYKDTLSQYMSDHNMYQRLDKLLEDAPTMDLPQIMANTNSIDRDLTRGMLAAEKKASPGVGGNYQWCPELQEAGLITQYWTLRIRELDSGYPLH